MGISRPLGHPETLETLAFEWFPGEAGIWEAGRVLGKRIQLQVWGPQ